MEGVPVEIVKRQIVHCYTIAPVADWLEKGPTILKRAFACNSERAAAVARVDARLKHQDQSVMPQRIDARPRQSKQAEQSHLPA
jgi:hypothetical protein